MKSALPLLLLGFALLPALTVYAANRFWISSAASNWNNTANWSNRSGGPGGFSIPTAGDNVTFDNGFVGNCTIDMPVNIRSITVDRRIYRNYHTREQHHPDHQGCLFFRWYIHRRELQE